MNTLEPLRRFFEQQLSSPEGDVWHFGREEGISPQHLASHLAEQTIHRAALDAATHGRSLLPSPQEPREPTSWKHCLLIAALTELRPLKMKAGNAS